MKKLILFTICSFGISVICQGQSGTAPLKNSGYYTINGDSTYKYIWKIRMQNEKSSEEYMMTGFKIADKFNITNNKNQEKSYLASALHGWARAVSDFGEGKVKMKAEFFSIEKSHNIGARIECDVSVASMNLEKDLVFFELIGCTYNGQPKPLFEPLKKPYVNEGLKIGSYKNDGNYIAYGFPGTKDLQPNIVTVSPNAFSTIYKLVGSNPTQLSVLDKLTSPSVSTDVIAMMANDIQPGLSGSPLVNKNTLEVIGMGDGAVLNQSNAQVKSWAIMLDLKDITAPKFDNIAKTITAYKTLLKEYTPGLFSSKVNSFIDAPATKVKYPLASPHILFSFFYKPKIKGIDYFNIPDVKSKTASNSEVIDASLELKPIKKFSNLLIGLYLTNSTMKYEIQSKDENGLPPNITTKIYAKTNQLLGLQTSLLVSQGTLHHLYVGAGLGGNLKNQFAINNYRVYAGFRKYLFHRQRFSIDAKALGIITKESFLIPNPYGNAVSKISNLNQLYICLGLNLSI
jgi:hypothetical protein